MKKLVLVLLLIPLVSFGQDEVTVIQSKTNISSSTNVENELVLSEKSVNVKVPFSADLSKYTHILLVDNLPYSWNSANRDSYGYLKNTCKHFLQLNFGRFYQLILFGSHGIKLLLL